MCTSFRFLFDVCDERKCENFISNFYSSKMTEIRKSITLYDDQYKFFKAFNSEKLLIAFVEFMFEDIEPQWLNEQEKILFDSLRIRMNNQKKKAVAWAIWWKKSHWWWRPENKQKTTEEQQNNKQKTSPKQAENKQDKDKDKEEDKDKDKEIHEENMCNKLHDDVSFEKFRNLYPNKKDKKKAQQKFNRMSEDKKQLAIDWISKLEQSQQRKKWFIPLPTTYLNWERREDEVEQKTDVARIQEYQRQARLEEARKLLSDKQWNNGIDEDETTDRRTNFISL